MSTIRNKVQFIGNVGNTPEITNLESSKKVARLSLATNDHYRNQKGESVQDTQWHSLVAWNKQAELIENYVPKGKEIAIEGKLISRSYEDKEGNKRYVTEILVSEILLLGSKD
ncbi:MAG: single-stranded DNA-binding protein [Zunongwangia sp.]|uniref:Single-stranded DNA-binding protein n=1 Tax=Zunongwangia profunda TaxID=398743 RepID=A0A3D5IYN9_9FLAO|nr:single-stranded DNA-binding protein [Zunongwangia profunda]MAB90610.1 single-stranded DNA-binding protein [Planctomycetota bacterium]MAO36214.1 single-stranded DNA-binding protein [Zunongwangia sp.]MBJ96697.1 single-stranded DNA-binding protein [Flavobacteriaceae bacterium]MAS71112.1 single-stranded DNA-binding protein [Zunongwangia sp.]HCV80995.1 single-stranded DNA-binding protein [Zunongwangia profunda]|tara:strand:+ start:1422 stop:1760 length:339 start_codon:yes stop_codon:yes gene_type:complete